jgi:hypothetical protein
VIELNTEFVDSAKVSIIPFNNMKKLSLSSKTHKIHFITDEDINFQYSTLYAKGVFELIRVSHSKECLSELEVTIT